MRMRFVGILLGISFVAALSCSQAGELQGTVRVPALTPHAHGAPSYPGQAGTLPGIHGSVRGLPSDAVVVIEQFPAAADSVVARWTHNAPRLAQKDQAFAPRVLAIAAGTVVDFPNMDPIYHNVFSPSPTRRFDLGKYPRGDSRRVTFPKPGLVNVYCDIHSDMEAFILVLPNAAFTRPDDEGAFVFPELPAGLYRVKVWHPDFQAQTREIEVPRTGRATCDFDLGAGAQAAGETRH